MNKFLKVAICAAAAVSVSLLSACDLLDSFLVHTHDMQFVAAKEATCTQDGNIEYYHCTKCGENFADEAGTTQLVTVVEKATGHDLEYVQPVEPTCTDGGSWGYYICSRCEEKFIDEDGETPATESELARPAKGHEYKVDVWENNAAGHWNLCDVCGERVNESAHTYGGDGICTVCGYVKGEDDVIYGNKEDIAEAELSIHFIELGNKYTGDCTLIKVGDTEVLIDAGSRQNSAPAIKEYVDEYCTDGKLEYVIATHADQDHIAGLVGNKSGGEYNGILYSYDIGTIIKFDRSNKSSGRVRRCIRACNAGTVRTALSALTTWTKSRRCRSIFCIITITKIKARTKTTIPYAFCSHSRQMTAKRTICSRAIWKRRARSTSFSTTSCPKWSCSRQVTTAVPHPQTMCS